MNDANRCLASLALVEVPLGWNIVVGAECKF